AGAGGARRAGLRGEGKDIRTLGDTTPKKAQRDRSLQKARAAFDRAFAAATNGSCPTEATSETLGSALGAFVNQVVTNTTVSPKLPVGEWQTIAPPAEVSYLGQTLRPICARGGPYLYFARRGTGNKLLVYYQGGGAC